MKQEFSTSWLSSAQPRKQRKYRYNAPLHIKHRFLSAHLSKDLRKKYGKRSIPLRKGDEVLVMQGSSKGKKAKVFSIDRNKSRVYLEGIQKTKKEGSNVYISFNPRVLNIQALNLEDKRRIAKLSGSRARAGESLSSGKKLETAGDKNASDKKGSVN